MTKFQKIRAWINRDDGKVYQIGNKNLGVSESVAYFLFILAMLVYVLHDKAGFKSTWVGWLSLVVGIILVVQSSSKEEAREPSLNLNSTRGENN
jgi:hypothetical protein